MAVPETAVDEDGGTVGRKHEVRAAGERTDMKSVPPASRVQATPQHELGLCVVAANAAHIVVSLCRRVDVGQGALSR
jgi:hypothetical protein